MIHHELFGQHLRLGNFLFKYAATIDLCKRHSCEVIYPDYYLWKYLKTPPNIYPSDEIYIDQMIRPRKWEWTQEEQDWVDSFGQDFKERNMQFSLDFFFQSAKWFEGYEDEVIKSLEPTNEMLHYLFGKHKQCFSDKPTIGLGIRLGDFVGHGDFFQIPYQWYIKALDQEFPNWKEEYLVVVFSDDIPKAKEIFKDYPFYYTDFNDTASHREKFKFYHGDASEQFFLGTTMDNFICGNSTFTWFQSFLATYNRKTFWTKLGKGGKVVHCGEVFRGKMAKNDTSNYYHPSWVKVEI